MPLPVKKPSLFYRVWHFCYLTGYHFPLQIQRSQGDTIVVALPYYDRVSQQAETTS